MITLTDTIPPLVDHFLQDIAQESGLFDYADIIKFGERATKKDYLEIAKLWSSALAFEGDEPVQEFCKKVAKIVYGDHTKENT